MNRGEDYNYTIDYSVNIQSPEKQINHEKDVKAIIFENLSESNQKLEGEAIEEVQIGILLTSFSDNYSQSLVAIPLVKFHKIKKTCIILLCR